MPVGSGKLANLGFEALVGPEGGAPALLSFCPLVDDGGHLVEGRVGVNPTRARNATRSGRSDGFVAEFFEASTAADYCRGNGMLRAQARLERIARRRTVGALDLLRMKREKTYRVRASDPY